MVPLVPLTPSNGTPHPPNGYPFTPHPPFPMVVVPSPLPNGCPSPPHPLPNGAPPFPNGASPPFNETPSNGTPTPPSLSGGPSHDHSPTLPTTSPRPDTTPATTTQVTGGGNGNCATFTVTSSWSGNYQGILNITVAEAVSAWAIQLQLSAPVDNFQAWTANVAPTSGTSITLTNKSYNGFQTAGAALELGVLLTYSGSSPDITSLVFNDRELGLCDAGTPTPTTVPYTLCANFTETSSWANNYQGTLYVTIPSDVTSWNIVLQMSDVVDNFQAWTANVAPTSGTSITLTNKDYNGLQVAGATLELGILVTYSGSIPDIISVSFNGQIAGDCGVPSTSPTPAPTSPPTPAPTSPTPAPTSAPTSPTPAPTPLCTAPTSPTPAPTSAPLRPPLHPLRHPLPTTHFHPLQLPLLHPLRPPLHPLTTPAHFFHFTHSAPTPHFCTHSSPHFCANHKNHSYDYDEVLHKSLLFYEAQRSGDLPASQRVTWRKDSALGDAKDSVTNVQLDLTGGYYDAGDYGKFGYPMSSMTTVLAWGAIDYGAAYIQAGEMPYMKEAVKWATDYFLKAHVSPTVLYGQVGNGQLDHAFWGRPEDMTMDRPAYKITEANPGSDLVAETSAALAAASILFKDSNPAYSAECLQHSRELYDFANNFRGDYDATIPGVSEFYASYGYYDELAWAAAWLYRATANAVFICLRAADLGINPEKYREFGKQQIHYMLGDTGRSYVVGFGVNPPQRPHHASSSCKPAPATCDWSDFHSPDPNPHVLYGALVGGPDANDWYEDKREDYVKNEVATDYNAGFQSAVAALRSLTDCGGVTAAPTTAAPTPAPTSVPTPAPTSAPTTPNTGGGSGSCFRFAKANSWSGNYDGTLYVTIPTDVGSWSIDLQLSSSVNNFQAWTANVAPTSGTSITLTNKNYNGVQTAGATLELGILVTFSGPTPAITAATFNGEMLTGCGATSAPSTPAPTPAPTPASTPESTVNPGTEEPSTQAPGSGCVAPGTSYDYDEVLHKSLLFYEAQRSGDLPASQRVTWRKDSALGDAKDSVTNVQLDLTGGYYDAGDYGKFGYPMSSMTTVLAWGAIDYGAAYIQAGEMPYMKEAVKWATDYFLKAHVSPTVVWPSRGDYDATIPGVSEFYASYGYYDELAWAAAWLYRATGETSYLTAAKTHFQQLSTTPWEFSWADKTPGVQVLLAQLADEVDKATYVNHLTNFCNDIIDNRQRTPKGLVYLSQWGSLRYAANAVFICLRAADLGINPEKYREFGKQQIHYMLGDTGRSYVVGFGVNPPQRPHHASSSCKPAPATCDWSDFHSPDPNPHVLYGALVGGPDANDWYEDKREDYVKNEVATDYNAGFQSAVAALRFHTDCGGRNPVPKHLALGALLLGQAMTMMKFFTSPSCFTKLSDLEICQLHSVSPGVRTLPWATPRTV
ncbi:Endoglucanase E-4 [Penaeus vannamei]|uniref:Endoglucanase n=1 Tax=Penaeus vannamei TaxID=6689 RepID=A0A423TMF4_PENVA|nr:Endoglucanase E-4 [Penaeus vannamei]